MTSEPAPRNIEPLLSAREAAARLGIGLRLLWQVSVGGELPSVRIGRRRLYDPADLRRFIDQRKRGER